MAWDGKIPYDDKGVPMVYAEPSGYYAAAEFRDNDEFEDTLTFATFIRGRSAARAVFRSEHLGCNVQMFLRTFEQFVPKLRKGKVTGTWKFQKSGKNFGICPA